MRISLFSIFSLCIAAAFAAPLYAQEDNPLVVLDCQVTPAVEPDYISLGQAETRNNLRRKEGAGIVANGVYTEINGVVLDRFCVPVSNALVYLWQTDKAGHYKDYYVQRSEWDIVDENYDENFAYSGTARTNNRGEFSFLTIFPGATAERAPHLKIKVAHSELGELETQFFFARHPRNKKDPLLQKIAPNQRELLMMQGEPLDEKYQIQGRRYHLTITLDGQNRFQRY